MLHVVSLAQYAVISTRSWAADSSNAHVRLKADRFPAQRRPRIAATAELALCFPLRQTTSTR
jgi:hypothetical protein